MDKLTTDTEVGTDTVRQLAVVMFADMTGYTALMQANEKKAKVQMDRQRVTLEKYIPGYQGRIIHFYGDGTLSVFSSAADAVRSAIAIQKELQKEPKVLLRIGLHMGDVVYEKGDIYGDCVNIASRIEALSVPGAVLISDRVCEEIKNQQD